MKPNGVSNSTRVAIASSATQSSAGQMSKLWGGSTIQSAATATTNPPADRFRPALGAAHALCVALQTVGELFLLLEVGLNDILSGYRPGLGFTLVMRRGSPTFKSPD